jgi:hypothetical protein
MTRVLRSSLVAIFAAALAGVSAARAGEAHGDGSATTKDAACKVAMSIARVDMTHGKVVASHCDCLENREEPQAPWSCQAFITYK